MQHQPEADPLFLLAAAAAAAASSSSSSSRQQAALRIRTFESCELRWPQHHLADGFAQVAKHE
jgi:hypothetical protein